MTSKIMRAALALAAGLGLTGLAAQAHAQSCDRACLIGVTDRYLAAVAAHDPSKAPLAPGVVFVENIKRMQPGEGLWKTASGGPTAFKVYVPDVALQQVGFIGGVQQDGTPMMLALPRLLSSATLTRYRHRSPAMRCRRRRFASVVAAWRQDVGAAGHRHVLRRRFEVSAGGGAPGHPWRLRAGREPGQRPQPRCADGVADSG